MLIGGTGADRIVGNADDDVLIAGSTVFDIDPAALGKVMAEWTSAASYADRTARLTGARTDGANAGTYLIVSGAGATVSDDGAVDVMTGSSGADWFLANTGGAATDRITDLSDAEFADDLEFINPYVGG